MSEGQEAAPAPQGEKAGGHDFWQECLEQLAQEIPEQQFQTWIRPLRAEVAEDFS